MVARELLRDNTGKGDGKVYLYEYPTLYEYNTMSMLSRSRMPEGHESR